jgi:putative ABC transport system substrate-binding protein
MNSRRFPALIAPFPIRVRSRTIARGWPARVEKASKGTALLAKRQDRLPRQRMRRRDFITLLTAAAVAPLSARAQAPAKMRRVGIVVEGMRSPAYDGFLQGMSELGYVAGRDYLADWRFADGRYLRILDLIGEFMRLNVDVIFLGSPAMVYPVRQATRTIPIVMGYSTDPVGNGFVSSLAHPGGNITGLASSEDDIAGKQMELLAGMVAKLARVALLRNPENSSAASVLKSAQAAAQQHGIEVLPLDARSPQEIDAAFARMAREGIGAVKVASDRFFLSEQQRLADLALKYRLPSVFSEREYAEDGGLMSLGESLKDFYRHAASFVDRIFKGAKPGDLPIEQPALFDFSINRKTAERLGIAIPPPTGFAAYQVIE